MQLRKIILLDIDGVMVTTPSWRPAANLADGFLEFNVAAAKNLSEILMQTSADIILTSTHRQNYTLSEWIRLMNNRGISIESIQTMDSYLKVPNYRDRCSEILSWVEHHGEGKPYVIIDDDSGLDNLPWHVKNRWVKTKPMIGLDDEGVNKAIGILNEGNYTFHSINSFHETGIDNIISFGFLCWPVLHLRASKYGER